MHNYSLLKKIVVCTLILVFSSSSFMNIVSASEGTPIGNPSGAATTNGLYPVTNLKVQTIYTLLEEKCVARLTWAKPSNLPDKVPYDFYTLIVGESKETVSSNILNKNTTSSDVNNLKCGGAYTFALVSGDITTGQAYIAFTLAKPASAEADGSFDITFNKITTTKSGTDCTATISWNRPKSQLANTRVTYLLYVFPKDKTSLNYTSPSLANTVSMQKTGPLTCGKDYSAQVVIASDGKPVNRIDQGFMMPTADGANKDAAKTKADPNVIKGEQDKAEKTEIDKQEGEGDNKCTTSCGSNWLGILAPGTEIKRMICMLQCSIIDWISSGIALFFNEVLVKNIE